MQNDFSLKIDSNAGKTTLPFEEGQQQALLGHIMTKDSFFRQVYRKVQPEWFTDPYLVKIYRFYCEYFAEYNRVPQSPDEFRNWKSFHAVDMGEKLKLYSKITLCHTQTQNHGMDYLADQMTAWQKTQIFLKDLPQIANLINSRQIEKAEQLMQTSAKELSFSKFDQTGIVEWQDYKAVRETAEKEAEGAMTTGLSVLDRLLLPESTGGGLLPGDTTVILAPTNTGKTSVMLTMGRHAVYSGKDVLMIVREGKEIDIITKTYQSFFKQTKKELWAWSRTPEGERAMDALTKHMSEHLHTIHMPKVNLYVEDVVADIYRLQAAKKAKTGKGYDMLIVDYPGIFQAHQAPGQKFEYRQIQDYIYRQFVQLGLEENFHVLAAAQTNREGSKVNRGLGGGLAQKRLLSVEDVAEAFGIAQSATNIITLNRDDRAAAGGYITFYLVKSRSSETGWAVTARSDYSRAITHSEELGATAYRGNVKLSDQIGDLLRDYKNRVIPDGFIDGFKLKENKEA